mmetsp:Transcript_37498/g.33142  ORF Transcript_37498/g.33142 Transcript_37498/m.33142 type:complete len:116 (+) Transcript_37498:67-414(+)
MAGCTLGCCGGFCLFVSIICAIMQFVFYALISNDNERIEIGESSHERHEYKNTPLITAIVYCVFILISVVCLAVPKKQVDFQDQRGGQIDERTSLVDNADAPMYDDQPASGVTEQ